jgi:excisionase family DNA binding protein
MANMKRMLTARQVQDILDIDRTTIYRMIKDGRLSGVKVGSHWRFAASEVETLASGRPAGPLDAVPPVDLLSWEFTQPAQDVFAEMAEIGAVIVDRRGAPLTCMSNSCEFCNLILESERGKKACVRSWQQLTRQTWTAPEFSACHAGLQYARASINLCGEPVAYLVAGQFYAHAVDPAEQAERVARLAREYQLDPDRLMRAAGPIRMMSVPMVNQIARWLARVAKMFEQIGTERADMLSRLQKIATMSSIDPKTPERIDGN